MHGILTCCVTGRIFSRDRSVISAVITKRRLHLCLLATAGGITFTIPAPSLAGCAFAEFDYALKQRQTSQQAKKSASAQAAASSRGSKEPQLASAFTREEAVAGCDVDEEDDDAGDSNSPHIATSLTDRLPEAEG